MATMKGSVSKMDDRMNNVEGRINYTNSTPQATFFQRSYYNHDQGGGRDVGINSIKTSLPPFKGECNPDDYLEWESLCERILQVNDLTEVKKSCFTIISQFEGFAITWWECMKRYHLVLQDGHPPPWTGLKALMRVKYVPERYR
ncbi:hypothetical protein R3W88_026953 [Solanum pinnatisectum]|uniref:Retrotransposon gag domain-containing protein n=1 Tax=Solanum pinnatisectum TaxID=50273 RepID=A0AAV9LHD9_9SOLN|nr:hypothetical protein R3W88_026953 [Solanum pinnatisectum]